MRLIMINSQIFPCVGLRYFFRPRRSARDDLKRSRHAVVGNLEDESLVLVDATMVLLSFMPARCWMAGNADGDVEISYHLLVW